MLRKSLNGQLDQAKGRAWAVTVYVSVTWALLCFLLTLEARISGFSLLSMKRESGALSKPLPVFANNYHPIHNGLCNAPTSFN